MKPDGQYEKNRGLQMLKKVTLVLSIFLLLPSASYGQYFGRNKVQYENFHFEKMTSDHFHVYFYPDEKEPVQDATNMLERWYRRQSEVMADTLVAKQPVILYANHPDFQQTNVISGLISQGTGGVTEGQQNRMVIPLTGVGRDNNHVLGHELVHAFQYDILKRRKGGLSAASQLPLWFIEGMAEYLSIGRSDPLTAMWMRDAVLNNDVPSIKKIASDQEYFPYRYGHALWAFITGNYDDSVIRPLLTEVSKNGWKKGVKKVLDTEPDSLSKRWQITIRDTYKSQLEDRTKPGSVGKEIISGEKGMNLSPVISPNGKYIALFSQQNLFSIDLYLADATTGEILDKLVSSNTDSHFDALRFINSAGTWSPDGKKFAFIVIQKGDDVIALLDVKSRKIERTIKLPDVGGITSLAWSPDGKKIVASATSGGISNLYLLNLDNNDEVKQLTNDKYAEIQPDWSPDGNTIAFASDRGSTTNFDTYTYSAMQLAFLDLHSGNISTVSLGENIKLINPQYASNGQDIYLISDPDGYSDIYRYSIPERKFYRVTKVATGISGLTELSPALSVARHSNQMVFTVFNKMNYDVLSLPLQANQGSNFAVASDEFQYHTALPPIEGDVNGLVTRYIDNATLGLPMQSKFPISNYNAKLRLVAMGQVGIGVTTSRFGAGIGGGVSMLFSDLLGNNLLGLSIQANGTFKDIGGEAMYVNRDHRYNWGVTVAHIPYRYTNASQGVITPVHAGSDSINALRQILYDQRIFENRISPMLEYPLSLNRRLEFSAGYTRISYSAHADTFYTDRLGQLIDIRSGSVPSRYLPDPINLFQATAAYVGDYSFSGYTSPVRGSRYRFEVEPTTGSYQFLGVLADYRKYFFVNPVTLAFRLMHYGRYFKDANKLTPLQLGYETWVRGYDPNTFSASECTGPNCPEFSRLLGSKVGIFNAELRLPLFGSEQFGLINFPYFPTTLVGFFDGGVAWNKSSNIVWKFERNTTDHVPVFSTGVAARINLFGYAVGQVYYVYPFQRPKQGAYFGFTIAPGW